MTPEQHSPPSTNTAPWTGRQVLAGAFIVLFALVQLVVPAVMLSVRGGHIGLDDNPRTGELPMSWQMFTVVAEPPRAEVQRADGSIVEVNLIELLGPIGARLTYAESGRRAVCAALPEAASVTVTLRQRMVTSC